jgi:hypothetical protein
MPLSVQIARLERAIAERFDESFTVAEVDLYSLEGDDRMAALDAVVTGDPSPLVIVGGRLVCTGSVDVEAILGALA